MSIQRPTGSMKVLIEDANAFHLNALQTLLRSFGLRQVTACADEQMAYGACEAYRPDIAFLHWQADEESQPANIDRFRAIVPDIEIIVLTGNPTPRAVEIIRRVQVQGLIVKPFTASTVKRYLTRCQTRCQDRRFERTAGPQAPLAYRRDLGAFA